ncbi:uncharacterized protein V2V93DRAFT_372545 [Kockiozyma suomiensis]|uniref:uncharacterized protein n=1 Tax=Kockiozyma suomiensis TaxID=1337062 RepID=UPI0033432A7B
MADRRDEDEIRTWRERLFTVNSEIVLTPQEYDTFFPYMENVYKIHGRSTNSKDAVRTQTMYFQCRIDVHATQRGRRRRESVAPSTDNTYKERAENQAEADESSKETDRQLSKQNLDGEEDPGHQEMVVDPAVVGSSDEYVAVLLAASALPKDISSGDISSATPLPPPPVSASSSSTSSAIIKRTRNRKPRETHNCPMKIKVVRYLDKDWNADHYSITKSIDTGHTHDLALSDRIVKNNKVLALFDPNRLADRMRLSARERRQRDLDSALASLRSRYNDLENLLTETYPDDKKRLDTTMRKWVTELQRISDDLVNAPLEAFFYS